MQSKLMVERGKSSDTTNYDNVCRIVSIAEVLLRFSYQEFKWKKVSAFVPETRMGTRCFINITGWENWNIRQQI